MIKITPTFYGNVEKGKLTFDHPERFRDYLKAISGQVMVVLKRPRKPRSIKENNYYFGVVIAMIADHEGMTPEEAHEAMKWIFLRKQIGKVFTVKSTALLDTIAFEAYVEQVRIYAQTELGIKIPLPNETE